MEEYWEIDEGKVDSSLFFRLLSKYFDDATTLYIEGCSISYELIKFYEKHRENGKYLPASQTIFPRSKKFRCAISHQFMGSLAEKAEHHAEPELLDHLSLYKNNKSLLEWHDAFANSIMVSSQMPESIVAGFSNELGLNYRKIGSDNIRL